METYHLASAEQIIEDSNFTGAYYYLAHLLDRILIGECIPGKEHELENELICALKKGDVLELHLFNEEKEVFISRKNDQYIKYAPLVHDENKDAITRTYQIMPHLIRQNDKLVFKSQLEVKEYISYDEQSNLAFVEKTVLYRLKE